MNCVSLNRHIRPSRLFASMKEAGRYCPRSIRARGGMSAVVRIVDAVVFKSGASKTTIPHHSFIRVEEEM